jgi:hypothetical protein
MVVKPSSFVKQRSLGGWMKMVYWRSKSMNLPYSPSIPDAAKIVIHPESEDLTSGAVVMGFITGRMRNEAYVRVK